MRKYGVEKGDRVLIYMPMIPQAIVAMLATARLGGIHSLVFGGFAAKELSTRIEHAKVCLYKRLYYKSKLQFELCHDIAEILLKLVLKTNQSINAIWIK